MKTLIYCCLVICAFVPSMAVAQINTLEALGDEGDVVSEFMIGTVKVTLSAGVPFTLRRYNSTAYVAFSGAPAHNQPLNPDNVSGDYFISTVVDGQYDTYFNNAVPLTFTFSHPIEMFRLTSLDLLESGAGSAATVSLTAYDGSDNIIDVHSRTGIQGASGLDLGWNVSGIYIHRVTMTGVIASGQGGFGIDDIGIAITAISTENSTWGSIKEQYK